MPHQDVRLNVQIGQTSQLQLTCQACHHPLQEDFEHGQLACPACGWVVAVFTAISALEEIWFQLATLLNALREADGLQYAARELFIEASHIAQFITLFT